MSRIQAVVITLTDAEMKALDELHKLRDLSKPQIFRQALRLYQLQAIDGWDTPRPKEDRLPPALSPQADVDALVEEIDSILREACEADQDNRLRYIRAHDALERLAHSAPPGSTEEG